MTDLKTLLQKPIAWTEECRDADLRAFLDDLQANILKGHGRHFTGNIFVSFAGMGGADVARLLRNLSGYVTSALHQLRTARSSAGPLFDGGPVRCLLLGAGAYRALGKLATMPADPAFQAGMRASGPALADPPPNRWGQGAWRPGNPPPDAMLLLADSSFDAVTRDLEAAQGWLNGTGARVLGVERGRAQFRTFKPGAAPEGVEHFGYVDGRSQPLFLAEDLAKEKASYAQEPPLIPPDPGFDPGFPPAQFILPDPNARHHPMAAGSYFVFRKLEQKVRAFKQREKDLAKALGLTGEDAERAGAMAVGRFEDGTPLTLHCDATQAPPPNNFSYANDAQGLRCPFQGHIRKTNPRGESQPKLPPGFPAERSHIMARRGIPFGDVDRAFDDEGHEPEGDVGLLFMAYMADIAGQFEFTQATWANNPKFLRGLAPGEKPTGIDPIIGQATDAAAKQQLWQDGCTPGSQEVAFSFADFVKLLGGDYFFAPSRSFLRQVGL